MDHLCWAILSAECTVGTLGVIDDRVIVLHVDGIKFTCLLTQLAGDAADAANVLGNAALVDRAASNHHTHFVRYDLDEQIGTNLGTGTTTHTLAAVYHCNAVFNIDGAVVTDLDAVAKAQTGLLTGASSSVEKLVRCTVLIALIVH